jgi:hypothetical protein
MTVQKKLAVPAIAKPTVIVNDARAVRFPAREHFNSVILTYNDPTPHHDCWSSSILHSWYQQIQKQGNREEALTKPYKNSDGIPVITEMMENET